MAQRINVYCDESCHLEHDRQRVMVLGALSCPEEDARRIARRIRRLKEQYGLAPSFEIKWSKVSEGQAEFYTELVDLFFSEPVLRFRALIVPDKRLLRHALFDQDHDTWYYKMYYQLLKVLLGAHACFRIYIDIKDTRSEDKVRELQEILATYLKNPEIVENIQQVRSHEVEQIQLADLLIGALSYANRGLRANAGKLAVVRRLRRRGGRELIRSTPLSETKVNLFVWEPARVDG